MTRHLVALSFGPVQSLIGAARRTRDLWCGSWLLSEAARAAACVLHERHPGCLIFPMLDPPEEELKPQDRPKGAANISNILRAEVSAPSAEAVRTLCNSAKEAAAGRLVDLGEKARTKMPLRDDVWRAQIHDILECYAAWVPVEDDNYLEASRRLGATLAARKATRDFGPSRFPASEGLPKSSLDGALETVLPKDLKGHDIRRRLGLSDNEQLDALGVMKRLAGDVEQFTAYSRVAADPWIESLTKEQQHELRESYEPLVGMQLATRVSGNDGIYRALPYDAQLLYPSRLKLEMDRTTNDDEGSSLRDLQKCLRSIAASEGQPTPYAAILKADGDKMGQFLSKAGNAAQSRNISQALHDFASRVRQVVQRRRGHAIYAGGDDVLALVPLKDSIACAEELAEQFKTSLRSVSCELNLGEGERPTLSVGLGIGHIMEPLGALRARAEEAEKLAKGDDTDTARNALAIVLGIRSGGEHCVRYQWSNDAALKDLKAIADAFRESRLPSRIAYGLRGIDHRWLRGDDSGDARGMRAAEVRRLLHRARTAAGQPVASQERQLIDRRLDEQPLAEVADLLIVARWLAARTAAEVGER